MPTTDINKHSIAYTVSNFLDNLENWVLNPNEQLNSVPTSFVNLEASTLAKISAYSYYNMLMSKRELTPSTAILMKSLLRQLPSDKISDIYGTCSDLQIVVSYPEKDIMSAAIPDGTGKYKLTLNKGTKFKISNYPPFTLDFNIDIYLTKYYSSSGVTSSIYAMYNVDDVEAGNVIVCNNPYITSRNDIIIDNKKHFTMYIDVKQYERNYMIKEMSGEASNIDIPYNASLMGFVVLYKPKGYNNFYKVNTYLEGEQFSDGVSYTLTNVNGLKNIRLKFSKLPNAFNPTNGVIKIVYYTTNGKDGNFDLGTVDEKTLTDLSVTYNQDISDAYQESLINIIPTVSITSSAARNGSNAKTLDEVRQIVKDASTGEVITPTSLNTAALKKGFSAHKQRHDLLAFEYLLTSFLKYKNSVIPTKMINGAYNFSDIPLDQDSNSRMIYPSDVFKYNPTSAVYDLIKSENTEKYSEFYEKYKSSDSDEEYAFPYFIRIQNGSNMDTKIYDESMDMLKSTRFTFLASSVLDKASIITFAGNRNPLSSDIVTYKDDLTPVIAKDSYRFAFEVNTSSTIASHLASLTSDEVPYVKFRLIFKNKTDGGLYAADIKLSECIFKATSILCNCFLTTSSSILNNGKIKITDNSLKNIPFSSTQYQFNYIDGTVDVDICVIFKELNNNNPRQSSKYDSYLTDSEINNKYYVGIIYSVDNVTLAKDMSENININSDIKIAQPEYLIAEEDIPNTYTDNVYKKDGENFVMEDQQVLLPDGTTQIIKSFVLLHTAGETKQTSSGCVGTFNTLGTADTWKWSDNESEDIVKNSNGDLLGNAAIQSVVQWNNLVIFGGAEGRVGCYDINTKTWHKYNTNAIYRENDISSGYVITSDGSPIGNADIRGMKIVKYHDHDVLFVYGELGRIASCDLSENVWKKYDGTGGNTVAIFYNNGSGMGAETIYDATTYTNSDNETVIVFAGGSGRICSLIIDINAWYNYNYDKTRISKNYMFSDGEERNYKSILAIDKYLESAIYCTGIDGICSIVNLTNGKITLLNDGSVVNNYPMYACKFCGNAFVIAGKNGYVASYNIVKSSWTQYDDGTGLCSMGEHMGGENINVILPYGVNILFAGGLGRISSYETTTSQWESYDNGTGLSNDGSFINNTISCVAYDTVEGDALMYFGGSAGNIEYKYRKGDIILNDNGEPIIKKDSDQIGYLKGIPAYSRLYAIDNVYTTINAAYNTLVESVASMNNIFVDGCSLHLGVKTTSGKSNTFYYIDPETDKKEYLNNLCIKINMGVKFKSNITSSNVKYLIENIQSYIEKYIDEIQTSTNTDKIVFNINDMLDSIKTDIPGIDYFEYYSLNGYSSSVCQTIYCDKTINSTDNLENEYLSIESSIDESESAIEEGTVVFKPNINISIL